ncbi:MAG: peptidylprolyl isomerase [Bacteroidales bacterium]|nr:peptidylprolyl isomerase [Bacteroidales bacterium]
MKEIIFNLSFVSVLLFSLSLYSQTNDESIVTFQTTKGIIKIKLYEETSMHKDNFIKLVSEGYYNGLLFHRVIKDFMIQTGDPSSRNAKPGVSLGINGPGYTIPAEFYPHLYHKKGAVAAARSADNVNPNRESSGSQFYIVSGRKFSPEQLRAMENSNQHIRFTDEQINAYASSGGAPHLDYAYTVFGEVIEGIHIVDLISCVETDDRDRPVEDVIITKAYISKK